MSLTHKHNPVVKGHIHGVFMLTFVKSWDLFDENLWFDQTQVKNHCLKETSWIGNILLQRSCKILW